MSLAAYTSQTKKGDAGAEFLFCSINQSLFWKAPCSLGRGVGWGADCELFGYHNVVFTGWCLTLSAHSALLNLARFVFYKSNRLQLPELTLKERLLQEEASSSFHSPRRLPGGKIVAEGSLGSRGNQDGGFFFGMVLFYVWTYTITFGL